VPEEPAARTTLAAQVVLVVVVPVVARLVLHPAGPSTDITVAHRNKSRDQMDAAVAEAAAARGRPVQTRPAAARLKGCPLVEVPAVTAH